MTASQRDADTMRVTVAKLSLTDLLANAFVNPRAHLDPERVAHYERTPASAAPVVVYETPQGRLLVDGYHRVAAAQRRGATTIAAEIRHGSRHDALPYAAANAPRQRGIQPDEALDYIRRRSGRRWGQT